MRAALLAFLFVFVATALYWWFDLRPWAFAPPVYAWRDTLSAGGRGPVWLFWLHGPDVWRGLDPAIAPALFKVLVWVAPSLLVVGLADRAGLGAALRHLGLDRRLAAGIGFGLVATAPLAFFALRSGVHRLDLDLLLGTAVIGPLAEEVLFRGFLFRELVARGRWPVSWAIAGSALAFGVAHSPHLDAASALEVLRMSAGGAVFAWVVYRTGSLWPAVALHGCLNLWITVAGPGWGLEGGEVASLALAVLLTFGRAVVSAPAPPARLS